jgi:DNA ligase (NAD+)
MTEAEAAQELERLAREIAHHNRLYHQQDAPEISDADYDALVRRNAELEAAFPHLVRPDSPSAQVGAAPPATSPRSPTRCRCSVLRIALAADAVHEFVGRVRRFLNLGTDEDGRAHRGAEESTASPARSAYEARHLVLADTPRRRHDGES